MLDSLLKPTSIAVIGASRTAGKVGHFVLSNLIMGGFAGAIYPINPGAQEILGRPALASCSAVGAAIDLGIVVVPAGNVMVAVEDAIAAGVKALAVITAGFKESGPAGAALEVALAERCAAAGIHLLGPNCLGLINTEISMNASFAPQMPGPGGISVISQSGALCTAILDMANGRGLGLAKLISIGNKARLCETDLLPVLAADPKTKVIACYLENITQGDAFIHAAEAAASVKPVVVLKAGTTRAGARAAQSHTGSLAGADAAYAAAFKRAGVIRAENFEALFDITTALAMQPLPRGGRVGVITNAGGPGIIAADALEHLGMETPPLSPAAATALKSKLPPGAHVGNPIDVLGDATPERYLNALNTVQDDESIDAIMVILTPQAMTQPAATAQTIIRAYTGQKPVLAAFMGGRDVQPARDEFVAADVPDYTSPDRAAVALKAMADYAAWRNRPPRVVTHFPVDKGKVEGIIRGAQRAGSHNLGEADAKAILRAYGFQTMPGSFAASAEEAANVADEIGYPVAVKIASQDISHKSDVGGVRLSLWNRQSVIDAFDLMMLRVGRRQPDAQLAGVYVEHMCPPGREVILGMTRDPQFGPILMFGLGGIFVEVMRDVSFYVAPITETEAMEMLESTRSFALLKGARGQAPVDLDAIAAGLQRISQLATEIPEILELDINPFVVGEPGSVPHAVDARVTIA